MSNSLREVKLRMTSTQKTAQITKAMNMVSASKLRRAEKTYSDYKAFMKQLDDVLSNIVSSGEKFEHSMLKEREIKKVGYIIITSDRGLAGPYNSNVLKALTQEITEKNYSTDDYVVGVIGTQGYAYCKKKGYNLLNSEPTFVRDDVAFIDIAEFGKSLISLYESGEIDSLVVIYNHYVNTLTQNVTLKQILPISGVEGKKEIVTEYEFDQGIEKSLNMILPMYVENMLYGLILDAKASEHSARMTAMKNATDNAETFMETLRLVYNRSRQAAITKELIDIVGGAKAVS